MSPASGDDPDRVARRRARQVARDLHPDRGGDHEAYLAALAALAPGYEAGPPPPGSRADLHDLPSGAELPGTGSSPADQVRIRQRSWGLLPDLARRRLRRWRRSRRRRPGSHWIEL